MDDQQKKNETPAPNSAAPAGSVDDESESLEAPASATPDPTPAATSAKSGGFGQKIRGLITHINIYFLIFIFLMVLSGGVVFISFQKNKKTTVTPTIKTQPLTTETLSQIKDSEAKVGDPKQTLTIESNAVFSGKVLVRDSLDIAGGVKIGGALSLSGLAVSGTSTFDQIQANSIALSGNATVQGQLNIQKGITSAGGASFGGPVSAPQITAQALQLSGDLQIIRHIDAGGGTPGKTDGTALGSGGTSSVSGTDTAGTVTINTGGSPAVGCFINVTFAQRFNGTPHVVATPVGSAAAGLSYYITRSNSGFSVCTTSPAPAGQTFSFDFIAMD